MPIPPTSQNADSRWIEVETANEKEVNPTNRPPQTANQNNLEWAEDINSITPQPNGNLVESVQPADNSSKKNQFYTHSSETRDSTSDHEESGSGRDNVEVQDTGPPPDGGWRAWLVAFSIQLLVMNTWGLINSFGAFQATYEKLLVGSSRSQISWIGSVQIFLLFFIGAFTGRLTDAGYYRHLLLSAACLHLLGNLTAAQATQYWQLFLSQGLCIGLGNGMILVPSLAVISTYFEKRRALAFAIVASGSATGGIIFPAIVRSLLPRVGFPWTMRCIAFVQMVGYACSAIFAKSRIPPRKAGPVIDWPSFRDIPYTLYTIGVFFVLFGLYFAYYYTATYASSPELRDPFTYSDSLTLLFILNGVGIPARLVPNYIADQYSGPLNMILPLTASSTILVFCWTAVHDKTAMYVWTVINGMVAAAVQGLFPSTLTTLHNDPSKAGVRLGMMFTIVSFAVLTSSPAGGAIITRFGGSYTVAICFQGGMMAVGTGFMLAAKVRRVRDLKTNFFSKM